MFFDMFWGIKLITFYGLTEFFFALFVTFSIKVFTFVKNVEHFVNSYDGLPPTKIHHKQQKI